MIKLKFKIEPFLFFVATIVSMLPVLACKLFPTYDGAAHIYNATLIQSMLFDSNAAAHSFFVFNSIPVPNWTCHVILILLKLVFPAYLAQKILLIIYFTGLPYAFRYLVKTLNPKQLYLSFLIFPFIFNYFLFLGFFNFLLAIIILIFTITKWMQYVESGLNWKNGIVLFFCICLTYFSHLFSFIWLLFFMGMYITQNFILKIIENKKEEFKLHVIDYLKKIGYILIVSFIPLVMLYVYFIHNPTYSEKIYLDKKELLTWLKNIRSIISMNIPWEEKSTTKIAYGLLLLIISILITKTKTIYHALKNTHLTFSTFVKSCYEKKDALLISAIILLFLYFVLPDADGAMGYVSTRLLLFFYIFIIAWIAVQPIQKWIGISVVSIIFIFHIYLMDFHKKSVVDLNWLALDCYHAGEYIPENSIVMPLKQTEHWAVPHFSNYMGNKKSMVILENYEPNFSYFPLKWNEAQMPQTLIGNMNITANNCFNEVKRFYNKNTVKIDYLFIIGDVNQNTDTCYKELRSELSSQFISVYKTPMCELFKYTGNK